MESCILTIHQNTRERKRTRGRTAQSSSLYLSRPGSPGTGVLGDRCGIRGHNVLGQLPRWQHAHGKSGGGAGPAGQPLQPTVHEGAHAAHGLGSDAGVLLPQHLADSAGWVSLCRLRGAVGRGEGSGWGVMRKRTAGTPGRILVEKEGKRDRWLEGAQRERTGDMAPESDLDL